MTSFRVRPANADEWRVLKHLRISALTHDPDAFGPTAAEARMFDDEYWQRFAAYFASPWRQMFIAVNEPAPLARSASALDTAATAAATAQRSINVDDSYGLLSAVSDRELTGHLGAFWIDPRARGTGLGATLFDAALSWLENDLRCPRVELSVTEGNDQAEAMYRRRGFPRSGRFEPLREGSALRNVFMTKIISGR